MTNELLAIAVAAFQDAVSKSGGQSAFARDTGARQQNVSNWLKLGKPLPGEFVLAAERATSVSRHSLRPDLYPRDEDLTVPTVSEDEPELFPFDATVPGAPLHGRVVGTGAPIVACDRSAILHSENDNG